MEVVSQEVVKFATNEEVYFYDVMTMRWEKGQVFQLPFVSEYNNTEHIIYLILSLRNDNSEILRLIYEYDLSSNGKEFFKQTRRNDIKGKIETLQQELKNV